MKKIPTLFVRVFNNHRVVDITPEVTPGLEWVLAGEGKATVKIDGSCCLIKNGELYRRYDAKAGRKPPEGAIPCCDPDPITGHWPHWVKCSESNPDDRWYLTAYKIHQTHLTALSKLSVPISRRTHTDWIRIFLFHMARRSLMCRARLRVFANTCELTILRVSCSGKMAKRSAKSKDAILGLRGRKEMRFQRYECL